MLGRRPEPTRQAPPIVVADLVADLAAATPLAPCQALFKQLFSFVNVNLFNQLLLRRECCSFSNGEHVRTGLAQVEQWIMAAGAEYVGDSWEELRYIRQVRVQGSGQGSVQSEGSSPCVHSFTCLIHLILYCLPSRHSVPFLQAVQFLVIGNKQKRTLEEITTDLCPVLSIQQLYRISTMYWDDR